VLAEAAALLGSHALSVEWSVECLTDSTAPRAIAHSSLVVAGHQAEGGVVGVNGSLELAAPRLWWPNGYGAQHRYRLTVRLWSGAGGGGGRGVRLIQAARRRRRCWTARRLCLECVTWKIYAIPDPAAGSTTSSELTASLPLVERVCSVSLPLVVLPAEGTWMARVADRVYGIRSATREMPHRSHP
jgi:hypothetical protein